MLERSTPLGKESLFEFRMSIFSSRLGVVGLVQSLMWTRFSLQGGKQVLLAGTQFKAVSVGLLQRCLAGAVSVTLDPAAVPHIIPLAHLM